MHETQSVPSIIQNTLPQVMNQHRHVSQQTKTKVPNKESSMRNRTQQASLVTLQIAAMLKHGSRFMTYYTLRTG
jgi:hypothetical protein